MNQRMQSLPARSRWSPAAPAASARRSCALCTPRAPMSRSTAIARWRRRSGWRPSSIRPGTAAPACCARICCDLSALPTLVAGACERFGGLDLLVNNASTFYPTPLGTHDTGAMGGSDRHQPAGAAVPDAGCGRAAARQPRRGHQHRRHPRHAAAARSRRLQHRQSRAHHADARAGTRTGAGGARQRHRPRRGTLAGERHRRGAQGSASSSRPPLQRPGSPADIARTVLFFAADAPFVTGQILAVDGGRSIGW